MCHSRTCLGMLKPVKLTRFNNKACIMPGFIVNKISLFRQVRRLVRAKVGMILRRRIIQSNQIFSSIYAIVKGFCAFYFGVAPIKTSLNV
jgi:hypothetical protein